MNEGNPDCPKCAGDGWVCENHPNKVWPSGCSCGAGMPCECNLLTRNKKVYKEVYSAISTLLDSDKSAAVLWDTAIEHFKVTGERIDANLFTSFLRRAHNIAATRTR